MEYLLLFLEFFKIGLFSFGGGYGMLPLMEETVVGREWITSAQFFDFVGVAESTPGPIAINMATFIGASQGGILGSVCATLGVVLPSFIIILIVAKCYDKFRSSRVVKGCMTGLKPAVVGLIANAILGVVITVFFPAGISLGVFTGWNFYVYAGIFAAMLVLALKKVHPILIICISAVLGIIAGYLGI